MKTMRSLKTFALIAGLVAPLVLAADVATAATVKVVAVYHKPVHEGDRVVLLAGAGEANAVTMTQDGSVVVIRDRVPLVAGPGCEALADGAVRCTVTPGLTSSLRVSLGDGDDSARLEGGQWATLHGGPGNDRLEGLPDGSNTFNGGTGNDTMIGGSLSDRFSTGAKPDGADTMIGGNPVPGSTWSSFDLVSYERRSQGVRADLDGDRDDGALGERDLIGADIEGIDGSRFADVLTGGPASDHLNGLDGRDLITGGGGTDYLVGDSLVVDRSRSEDRILGGGGNDVLTGGAGGDRLAGGPGDDTIYAGPGADRVRTRDGAADTVICGSGRDTLLLDSLDFPRPDCELLRAR
jgi:Ca2+-binding RTX toxin-like protein